MPGYTDVWNHVTPAHHLSASARAALSAPFSALTALGSRASSAGSPGPGSPEQPDGPPTPQPRRRAVRLGALAATLVVLAAGSVATASAHKTVTLDVDGHLTDISTFAGSIDGLLDDQGVELAERDVVAPSTTDALHDGDQVVVRHAHPLVVLTDGEESTVWTTALNAEDALASLDARGEVVQLLPSRSLSEGRAELTVQLSDGPVDVLVDGGTEHLADGGVGLDKALRSLGVTLGGLDRVHLERDASGHVVVVVQRVVAQEQTTLTELPFQTVTQPAADLFKGQSKTSVVGVTGEQTTLHRVILVDGVEESRVVLNDTVTRAPVDEVVLEGTKARPAAAPRASVSTGGAVVGGDVWASLAQCESGGNPGAVSRNGLYYGLYQFSVGTWQAMGGSGLPSDASPSEQTERAQALQARSGWGQWPACASKLGLL